MKKALAIVLSGFMALSTSASVTSAQSSCPEVDTAKRALEQRQATKDVSATRSLAGARAQEAPRSQQEAPRTVQQAPRSQQEAPRTTDVQAPRSLAGARMQEAPRSQQEAPRS